MLSVVMLNVIILSVANKPFMLSGIMMNVIMLMLSVANKRFMLSIIMLNVIMLIVIMLNVVTPV